jgi:hypothetical protein
MEEGLSAARGSEGSQVKCLLVLAVAGALVVATPAAAQYSIPQSVVGAGGGAMSGSANQLVGTVGQPAIGVVSGPSNIHEIGFWYQPGWILTGVGDEALPTAFWLGQGYPNPFNPRALIRFAVPSASRVRIALYNVAGREVRVLLDEEMEPGFHIAAIDAHGLPSGVYFCRMVSGSFVDDRKLVLLK